MECVLIGHEGHPEVEGTMGQYNYENGGNIYLVENEQQVADLHVDNEQKLAYVTQTTLSVDDAAKVIDALKTRFPSIQGPRKDDICYATQNRQDAVKALSGMSDIMLVVGSPNSSNSNRLRELSERMGTRAYLIDDQSEIQENWLDNVRSVSVTAGASAPEILVQDVVRRLKELGAGKVNEIDGRPENIVFSMPKALRIPVKNIQS
jgi:4-hydroxy-3-methylbut-2-enyl diphosphate reductase